MVHTLVYWSLQCWHTEIQSTPSLSESQKGLPAQWACTSENSEEQAHFSWRTGFVCLKWNIKQAQNKRKPKMKPYLLYKHAAHQHSKKKKSNNIGNMSFPSSCCSGKQYWKLLKVCSCKVDTTLTCCKKSHYLIWSRLKEKRKN